MYAKKALILSLLESKFVEVKNLQLTSDIWTNLQELYQGNIFVKKCKLDN